MWGGGGGGGLFNHLFLFVCLVAYLLSYCLTPSLPQLVKLPGWKVRTYDAPVNSIFSGLITNLLSTLCSLIEILSTAYAKGEKKGFNDFKFGTFNWSFSLSVWVASMAVKGLTGTHFMFVFISALSAGRHDATLWSLVDVRLWLEEQHYSVMYIFVHFYIFSFCFVKKKFLT